MARTGYGKHATQVDTNTYPDDPSVPIGSDEWNAEPSDSGMLGFSAETIASATSITPSNTVLIISGSTDVATIAQGNTNEYDLLYIFTSGTVTLVHNTGNLQLISGANKDLSTTVPTILIRKGTDWVEYGGGGNVTGTVMSGHIIPDTDDTYDIGSAEYKIRDLYVSDNSLWVGDEHKIEIQGGKMKFKKRKSSSVPTVISNAGGNEAGAKSHSGKGTLEAIKLNEWVAYARSLGGSLANAKPNDIFRSNQSDDWNTDEASITSEQASAITANTAKTGITTSQTNAITANTAKVGLSNTAVTDAHLAGNISLSKLANGTAGKLVGFNASTGVIEEQDAPAGGAEAGGLVLPYDSTIGNYTTPTTLVASSSSQEDNATSQQWASFDSQGYNQANPVLCSGAGPIATGSPAGAPVDITIAWTFQFSRGYGWGSGGISVQHDGGETCLAQSSSTSYSTSGTSSFTGVTGVRGWGRNYTGSAGGAKFHRVIATFTSDLHTQLPISNAKDDSTSTRWMSETEDNPNVSIDMGSSTRMDHLAINYNSGDGSTETQFLVQTSDDDSTWTTQRTINLTQLSNGWNYIRFTPVSARYVRVYGTGSSKRLSLRELKVKNSISDTTLYETHGHKTISTTDTSIGLNGN